MISWNCQDIRRTSEAGCPVAKPHRFWIDLRALVPERQFTVLREQVMHAMQLLLDREADATIQYMVGIHLLKSGYGMALPETSVPDYAVGSVCQPTNLDVAPTLFCHLPDRFPHSHFKEFLNSRLAA